MTQTTSHAVQYAAMLIDLDCILDTRHGTLAKFGTSALAKALTTGYFTRNSDHFFGIDPDEYFRLYRERDAVTLSMSVMSHGVSIMKDFVKRVHLVSASAPINKIPRVDVNIWPYDLTDAITARIDKALRVVVDDKFDMSFVSYKPEDLHYDLIKFTYDHLCMYNIGPLIEHHAVDWERRGRGLPDVTVFTPMLSHSQDAKEVPDDITATIEKMAAALAPVLNVMFLPINFFCTIVNPFEIEKMTPPQDPKVPEQSA